MNYLEHVNAHFSADPHDVVPAEIMEHAFSLRYSAQVQQAASDAQDRLNLKNLPAEDRRLFQQRIMGGLATKLAIASYLAEGVPAFSDLSGSDQNDQLKELADVYSSNLGKQLDSSEEPQVSVLELDAASDPLPRISNAHIRAAVHTSRLHQLTKKDRWEMVRSYLNTKPGTFPPSPYAIPPVGTNDSVLAQAFGRDSIDDKDLITVRDQREALRNDEDTMKYLDTTGFKPGPSNIALAKEVDRQLQSRDTPELILQWEVAYALRMSSPHTYARYQNYIHVLWPHSGFYPTYDVKADSVKKMDQLGLYNPQELAHGDMMVRALAILNKLGIIADPIAADIPFDPLSTQPHVQNKHAWVGRERLARAEHVLRGRVKL